MIAKHKQPLINKKFAVFLLGMVLVELSRTMTLVQVPIFLRELGAEIEEIGLFFTISLIFPLILKILGGWFSDTFGRLRALSYGSVAGILSYIAYLVSPSWEYALIAPAFLACASALIFPSYKAYIADHTDDTNRGRVFGISQAIVTAAWIIGPPIGGYIAGRYNYRAMFAVAAISFAVATMIFTFMVQRTPRNTDQLAGINVNSLKRSFTQMWGLIIAGGLVTWVLIVDGVRDIAFKLSFDLMPVYLSEIASLSKESIGLLDGLFGLALALSVFLAGYLIDRTSERTGVVLGLIVMISSRLVFAIAAGFWGFGLSWILLGIGGGLIDPAGSSLIARGVPKNLRGIAYGLIATSLGIFSLPAPWLGSQIWKYVGPKAPFLLTVVLGSLIILPAWHKLRTYKEISTTESV